MKTNNPQGRAFATSVGIYLIVKSVLNMIIGGELSISSLLIAIGGALALVSGMQFVNFVVAGILFIVAVTHFPANISNFGSNWIYLVEGIIDIACAVLLVTKDDIKAHFTTKWTETSDIFKNK
ncbi:MAG: hypothetical protein K2J40_02315 [Ruminococcus sp.]|nr:hypothetical protein [Ruminococcus sp.]